MHFIFRLIGCAVIFLLEIWLWALTVTSIRGGTLSAYISWLIVILLVAVTLPMMYGLWRTIVSLMHRAWLMRLAESHWSCNYAFDFKGVSTVIYRNGAKPGQANRKLLVKRLQLFDQSDGDKRLTDNEIDSIASSIRQTKKAAKAASRTEKSVLTPQR